MKAILLTIFLLVNLANSAGISNFFQTIKEKNKKADTKFTYDIKLAIGLVNYQSNIPVQMGSFQKDTSGGKDIFEVGQYNTNDQKTLQDKTIQDFVEKLFTHYDTLNFIKKTDTQIEEEIVFISVNDKNIIDHMKATVIEMTKEKTSLTKPTDLELSFTFKDYNDTSKYNKATFTPIVAVLKDEYEVDLLGFKVLESCTKNTITKTTFPADKLKVFLDKIPKLNTAIIDYYKTKTAFYLDTSLSEQYYNFTENNIKTNITIWSAIINTLSFDCTLPQNKRPHLNSLCDNLSDSVDLKKAKTMFGYDYNTFSNIHNYLQVEPFFYFLIQEFNHKILQINKYEDNKEVKKGIKMSIFGVSEDVIYGIIRMLNYDWQYDNINRNDFIYEITDGVFFPIPYGEGLIFELITGKTDSKDYILLRMNSTNDILFIVPIEDFSNAINEYINYPPMTKEERKSYCN